jgi:hypothetical protein
MFMHVLPLVSILRFAQATRMKALFSAYSATDKVRIRITKRPNAAEFADFSLAHLQVGEVHHITPRLANLLVIAGCAEQEIGKRWESADFGRRKRK